MSIKVISDEPDPSVVKRATCRNCGVRLEYTPADTKEDKRTDYTGDVDYVRIIVCPKCNHVINVTT